VQIERSYSRSSKSDDRPAGRVSGPVFPTTDSVKIAQIAGPHGLRGAVVFRIDPSIAQVVAPGLRVEVAVHGDFRPYSVRTATAHRFGLRVGLDDVDTRERADALSGADVYVARAALPEAGADEYYDFEVLGWEVVTCDRTRESGVEAGPAQQATTVLGTVDEILVTGANDVYVVRHDGNEILIPVTRHAVLEIDRARRRIVVEPSALVYPDHSDSDG
jgi:16S rRNA processing protein RimM